MSTAKITRTVKIICYMLQYLDSVRCFSLKSERLYSLCVFVYKGIIAVFCNMG